MKRSFVIVGVLLIVLMAACQPAPHPMDAPMAEEPAMESLKADGFMGSDLGMEAPAADIANEVYNDGEFSQRPQTTNRMVIMNASLSIIVDDPELMVQKITQMTERKGGFIVQSNVWKYEDGYGNEIPQADMTIRVPAELLNQALDEIKFGSAADNLEVINENISGQDVTFQYTDLKSRVTNLEKAEAQLQTILENAEGTEDVVDIFRELTSVREQIEMIRGQMKYYEESASMSAITLSIRAHEKPRPVTPTTWNPAVTLSKALQNLVKSGQNLVDILIWLIIVVIPFGLIFAIPVLFIRWVVKRAKKQEKRNNIPEKID